MCTCVWNTVCKKKKQSYALHRSHPLTSLCLWCCQSPTSPVCYLWHRMEEFKIKLNENRENVFLAFLCLLCLSCKFVIYDLRYLIACNKGRRLSLVDHSRYKETGSQTHQTSFLNSPRVYLKFSKDTKHVRGNVVMVMFALLFAFVSVLFPSFFCFYPWLSLWQRAWLAVQVR